MFTIIGGVYKENCLDPAYFEVLGSGGRAAIAVSQLVADAEAKLRLVTYSTTDEAKRIGAVLAGLGVQLDARSRSQAVEFQYNHSADKAVLYPDYRAVQLLSPPDVSEVSVAVLIFSLIECEGLASFQAKRAVYDPQAGPYALPFRKGERRVEELAIVCNYSEAIALTKAHGVEVAERTPLALGRAVLSAEAAQVVIVKNGPFGALAVTKDDHRVIPSYKTGAVFGIGTGDIYSAIFAYLWAFQGTEPFLAAELASVATAYSCSQGVEHARLPIVPTDIEGLRKGLVPADLRRVNKDGTVNSGEERHIYLAGPFFSLAQIWLINEIKRALEDMRLNVWSPMAEVGILPPGAPEDLVRNVVKKDLAALDGAAMIFAVLDGLDPGTLYEIGYASSRGIPVVALSQQPASGDLTMLAGTPTCSIFTDLATALYHAAWIVHGL